MVMYQQRERPPVLLLQPRALRLQVPPLCRSESSQSRHGFWVCMEKLMPCPTCMEVLHVLFREPLQGP